MCLLSTLRVQTLHSADSQLVVKLHFEVNRFLKTDLQVSESEDHRFGEVHSAGSSVHGGGDNVGVDHQAPTPGVGPLAQPQTQP